MVKEEVFIKTIPETFTLERSAESGLFRENIIKKQLCSDLESLDCPPHRKTPAGLILV